MQYNFLNKGMNMKYQGCLLAVRDISASKHFYENVLHQNAIMDIGAHVTSKSILK